MGTRYFSANRRCATLWGRSKKTSRGRRCGFHFAPRAAIPERIQVSYGSPPTPRGSERLRRSWKLSSGSGAPWMHMRGSWDASQGHLRGLIVASGGLFGASWGPLRGRLEALWGFLGAPRGPPGGSRGHLGVRGSTCQFVFALFGLSRGPRVSLLGRLVGPWGRLGAILSHIGALGPRYQRGFPWVSGTGFHGFPWVSGAI